MTNPPVTAASPAGARKKVVFLTFYYEAWDALAEIYELMSRDSRFEVAVVAIDRRLTGEVGFSGANKVSSFFESLGIPHLVNADLSSLFDAPDRSKTGPDYIFVNYPWQRNYSPQYRPDQLARIGRIVYVPYYSLPLVQEPIDGVRPESGFIEHAPHLYSQRMHQLTSIDTRQFGSTKLDALVRDVAALSGANAAQASSATARTGLAGVGIGVSNSSARGALGAEKKTGLRRILWAPHHSYSAHWLNFGNFARVHEQMLQWAAAHGPAGSPNAAGTNPLGEAFEVVLRAHPFMFGTLADRGVMSQAAVDDWLARWSALPNTRVEVGESAAASFAAADYLITDGISFLAEWPLAKKRPAIFMENPEHWPFTELGELCGAIAVKSPQVNGLDAALLEADKLVARNSDAGEARAEAVSEATGNSFEVGLQRLRDAAIPNAGQTAARIVEAVAADSSPLIDPATVTEVPWELQPGREPLD